MPKLTVCEISKDDVYKDIVRIPEPHRVDRHGKTIEEATVCWIDGVPRRKPVILRGYKKSNNPEMHVDERTRNRLGIRLGNPVTLGSLAPDFGVSSFGRGAPRRPDTGLRRGWLLSACSSGLSGSLRRSESG